MEILHGGTGKFFRSLICFFRSFISFFRSFVSGLRGEFSFAHWRFPISYRGERCEAGDASEQVCPYSLQFVRFVAPEMSAVSKVVCIFATTTSDYMPMKQILHTIYTLIVCALLVPCSALASDKSEATERQLLSDQSLVAVASQPSALEQSAPQVEVRDGAIVPLCEYDQMQVFNVMGQEVRNEHLPSGVYLVRIVVKGETYTLKVVIR